MRSASLGILQKLHLYFSVPEHSIVISDKQSPLFLPWKRTPQLICVKGKCKAQTHFLCRRVKTTPLSNGLTSKQWTIRMPMKTWAFNESLWYCFNENNTAEQGSQRTSEELCRSNHFFSTLRSTHSPTLILQQAAVGWLIFGHANCRLLTGLETLPE